MKKVTIIVSVYLLFTQMVTAQLDPLDLKILEGDRELQFSGAIIFDHPAGTDFDFSLRRGWFVRDHLIVGFDGSIAYNDDRTRYGVGLYTDYHFDLGYYFVPFTGISALYNYLDPASGDSGDYLVFEVYGGSKYFITNGLALSGRLLFQYATDDVFLNSSGPTDTRFSLRFGLHYHY